MDTSKIIKGVVNSGRYTVTAPIIKEDYGLYLQIEGVELPQTYEVDFSNSEHSGTSVTMIGNSDGVLIPSQFISTGKDVFAFLYHVGEDFGRTIYKFRIPNKVRPDRTSEQPTPEEQSLIDQAIGALNTAVEQTAQDVESAEQAKDDAESARDNAQTYANNAQTSATQASTSASQASASATASAQSASQSAQIKADVEDLAEDAQASANASAQSASASANSASQASGYAQSASASAQSASGYASSAQTSAQTASAKASEASTGASTASQKATEASQSASQALTYKTDAESAKTASQTAQGLAESARDSAITAKNDAESARDDAESARDEAQSAVASISGALDDKAPVITDTASGSIASFSDGADNLPLKSLIVDINPIQDLHGQDSPYPAGGGKNLLPYPFTLSGQTTVSGVTFSDNGDGTITATGTATATAQIDLYTSAYASNIQLESGATYTLSGAPSDGMVGIVIRKSQSEFVSEYWDRYGAHTTFTVPSDDADYRARVITRVMSGTTVSNTVFKPQLEKGSTATAYAPYENICPISGWTEVNVNHSDADTSNPTTITIQLGQTVYGGKLDVLGGVLVIDRAMVDIGAQSWTYTAVQRWFYNYRLGVKSNTRNAISSMYAYKSTPDVVSDLTLDNVFAVNNTSVCIRNLAYTDATAFKAAMSGVQLVYELAEPQTYQLTPHEVNSLLGVNNIWADSGDTTAEYRADTKAWIQRKIAEAIASLT